MWYHGERCDPVHELPHISESFLTVKGAAVFLPRGNGSSPSSAPRISQQWNKHTGDLQQHLQTMFTVLRPEDNIRLAVRLESAYAQPQCTRYMVVVSTNGRQDTEESVVLGLDFGSSDRGFSVSTVNRVHVFKPVSVQAMWSALQSLHKACEVARCHNYYPGSLFLTWVSYYQSQVSSDQVCINEWNAMQDVQSHRADSPILFTDVPTERERTERLIKTRLREIMMQKDLENVTSKEIRTELEMQMVCNLREFKEFIDNEMIVILGQMDSPTEIFDHVYLGSEWNASNLEELQTSGVRYILNVTREIDNFFPGVFEYHNIRVYDEEATNLLEYWNDTYKFITKARKAGAKCLVHCKMGVSRSASTVIAYAMKEYGWDLERAFDYVKERRGVTKPNPSFMKQLEEYQGILLASKQRHNKLWRSHSDSDLSERHESPLCKTGPPSHTLGLSDPHNNNNNNGPTPSLQHFLLQALGAANDPDNKSKGSHISDTQSEPPIPIIVCSSLEPSRVQPQAPPALLWLEGVTALDSDTDGPSPPPPHHGRLALARSSEELEKIQETLRELQAFLYDAGGLGAGERPGQGKHHGETPVWQRAMEIEARIRQAGLTPPSLMKRSASLAKLDCLELSANDLNDWDLRPTTASPHGTQLMPTPHPRSHHHPSPDDVSKKQRVLSRAPLGGVYPLDSDRTDRGSQRAGSDPPCLSSPPCLVLQGDEELETDPSPRLTRTQSPASAPDVTMITAQQQPRGKSHPLRRLRKAADKKRTATVLYHTM
uniref:protein-serine/threonine phosphatase n=1 Tax=Oncorhynchus kisutch TaxID=8019 RepID=A0A8C7JMN1_ONCKI